MAFARYHYCKFTGYIVTWIKISIKNKKKLMNIFGLSFNCVYWDAVGRRLILNSPKSTVHYGGEYYANELVERFKIHMQN